MKTSVFKKLVLLTCSALIGVSMSAQTVKFEINAGANFSSYSVLGLSTTGTGGFLGANVEYNLPNVNGLYMNGGLNFGIKPSNNEYTYCPLNLEVPIHVGYKYMFSDKIGIFGEAGPYVGVRLADLSNLIPEDEEDDYGYGYDDDNDDMKKVQFGAGFKLGVICFSKLKVFAGWDYNFLSCTDLIKTTHNNAYVGVGFVF